MRARTRFLPLESLSEEWRGVGGSGSVGGSDGKGVMTAVMRVKVEPCGVGKLWTVTREVLGIAICNSEVGEIIEGFWL